MSVCGGDDLIQFLLLGKSGTISQEGRRRGGVGGCFVPQAEPEPETGAEAQAGSPLGRFPFGACDAPN
jgi:hypothetical protein